MVGSYFPFPFFMKNFVTLALFGLTVGAAQAQTTPLTKGRGLLSGSIGYHHESYDTRNKLDIFNLSPSVGVFVADNLLLGINANLTLTGSSYSGYNIPDLDGPSLAIGPFARYYRFVGGDKFALFGEGGIGYIHNSNSYYSAKLNQGYVAITPGLAFFPVPRFGIEASLRGLNYATNFDNSSTLDLGFSLRNFQLGAAYYFGK